MLQKEKLRSTCLVQLIQLAQGDVVPRLDRIFLTKRVNLLVESVHAVLFLWMFLAEHRLPRDCDLVEIFDLRWRRAILKLLDMVLEKNE